MCCLDIYAISEKLRLRYHSPATGIVADGLVVSPDSKRVAYYEGKFFVVVYVILSKMKTLPETQKTWGFLGGDKRGQISANFHSFLPLMQPLGHQEHQGKIFCLLCVFMFATLSSLLRKPPFVVQFLLTVPHPARRIRA